MADPVRAALASFVRGVLPPTDVLSEAFAADPDPAQLGALRWAFAELPQGLAERADAALAADSPALRPAVEAIPRGRDLTESMIADAFAEILSGAAAPAWIGAFLTVERMASSRRGTPVEALVGGARAMRGAMVRVSPKRRPLLDTCGTGGDGLGLLNLSTAGALVAAACGAAVAKHGNRAASSQAGSADLLEAWGVPLDPGPEAVARAIDGIGFGFCFAPAYHPAARHAAPARKSLGFRTLFNLLGPLANPAGAERQILGVPEPGLVGPMAEALRRLGTGRALVFRAACGADELVPGEMHDVALVESGKVHRKRFRPEGRPLLDRLKGGTPAENAARLERLLSGAPDAAADAVALNAGAALAMALDDDPLDAIPGRVEEAHEAIRRGRPADLLRKLKP